MTGSETPESKKHSHAAKRVLKSLITLDSYEPDVSDNMQNEQEWNEMSPHDEKFAGKESDVESLDSDSNKSDEVSDAEVDSVEKSKDTEEFEKAERARDAALPEEYRKFRPRGYGFRLPPKGRPVRIYADGVFDLFHLGHMKQLEQAKKALPNVEMVVGVPSDELVHKYKGLTVLTDEQRYETLRHCRWVDEVIPNAPWEVNEKFLDEHHIDYVAHDDMPYGGPNGEDDVYKFVKERGQFLTTQRTEGVSTSDIITRIVKDYDLYLMRNFQRGVSRKELNVSWIKKNELDIKRHVNAFRTSWRNNLENATRDLYADLLSYALNAPGNSVVGRARDWVSRRLDSHGNSARGTPAETPEESPEESSDESLEASESEVRSPKRRRVSTA